MQLSINIPDNIFFGINETEKSLTQILKQKLAIELYKSHQIPVIDDYDIEDEVANAKRILA